MRNISVCKIYLFYNYVDDGFFINTYITVTITWKIPENLNICNNVCVETILSHNAYTLQESTKVTIENLTTAATDPGLVSMCKGITKDFNM